MTITRHTLRHGTIHLVLILKYLLASGMVVAALRHVAATHATEAINGCQNTLNSTSLTQHHANAPKHASKIQPYQGASNEPSHEHFASLRQGARGIGGATGRGFTCKTTKTDPFAARNTMKMIT